MSDNAIKFLKWARSKQYSYSLEAMKDSYGDLFSSVSVCIELKDCNGLLVERGASITFDDAIEVLADKVNGWNV